MTRSCAPLLTPPSPDDLRLQIAALRKQRSALEVDRCFKHGGWSWPQDCVMCRIAAKLDALEIERRNLEHPDCCRSHGGNRTKEDCVPCRANNRATVAAWRAANPEKARQQTREAVARYRKGGW